MVVINNLSFNQDYSCISLSTSDYHKIFNCDPFGEFYSSYLGTMRKSISSIDNNPPDKTTESVEKCPTMYLKMLFSTSLTIIVPQSSSNLGNRVLKIFNLKQNLKICELTFPSHIIDIKLNRKRLIVFLEIGQIYIYDLSCVRLIKVLEINPFTSSDIKGSKLELTGDLCSDDKSLLVIPLALINEQTDLFNNDKESQPSTPVLKPSDSIVSSSLEPLIEFTAMNHNSKVTKEKEISIEDLQKDSNGWVLVYNTVDLKPKLLYKAHNSSIAKITISNDGTKIATASTKGTIVRVHQIHLNISNSEKLSISQVTNLRRGHNLAKVNSLKFNLTNTILGCGSESNTIHFFNLAKLSDSLEENTTYENDVDDDSGKSSEDLNENLANLLISKPQIEADSSYFSYGIKKTTKLLNNHYTKSIIKKLPYTDYIENLIWEPPKRSFAYIKLPEYTPNHELARNKVEIGFNNLVVLLASYQTGIFYQYHLPKDTLDEKRREGFLISQNNLLS